MSSETGFLFSFAIGVIFLAGGIVFLLFLDENRFLFGLPYTILGLVIVVGLYMGRKRRLRQDAEDLQEEHSSGPDRGSR